MNDKTVERICYWGCVISGIAVMVMSFLVALSAVAWLLVSI